MNQNANFVQEKKIKNFEWIQSENVYTHDSIFFTPITQKESWNFGYTQEISYTSLSFLFMRSLLCNEITGSKIQVTELNQFNKAKLGKSGLSMYFNEFLEISPILGIPNPQVPPGFFPELFYEGKFFQINMKEKKSNVITGGGILKEKKTNTNEFIEKVFNEFDLTDKSGHFFLKTKQNSYLYLLNPENKSKTFYIQQKSTFPIDFHFYHITLNV